MFASFVGFIKKLLLLALCLLAITIGGLFAYENPGTISPVVFGYSLPNLSLGVYLTIILLLGVILGLILSIWGSQAKQMRLKMENRRLRKALESDQKALGN